MGVDVDATHLKAGTVFQSVSFCFMILNKRASFVQSVVTTVFNCRTVELKLPPWSGLCCTWGCSLGLVVFIEG